MILDIQISKGKNMKNVIYIILFLATAIILGGCTNNPDSYRFYGVNDTVGTTQGQSINVDVLANDSYDPSSEQTNTELFVSSIFLHPSGGMVEIEANNTITYIPDNNFTGTDTFRYKLGVHGTDTSTGGPFDKVNNSYTEVTVNVEPDANTAPSVKSFEMGLMCDDDLQTAQPLDITLSGNDNEGDMLTYMITQNPNYGTLSAVNGNSVTYQMNSSAYTKICEMEETDMFKYKANDSYSDSQEGTVTIMRAQ